MNKKVKVSLVAIAIIVSLLISAIVLMGIQTTPSGFFQEIVLVQIRNCIWYGIDGYRILDKDDGEKDKIVLPESLSVFTPFAVHYDLTAIESFTEDCDLIYNPKGYENKTWIVIYNANDIGTRLSGNYVLWSTKEITRKKGMLKEIEKPDNLKYYSIPE